MYRYVQYKKKIKIKNMWHKLKSKIIQRNFYDNNGQNNRIAIILITYIIFLRAYLNKLRTKIVINIFSRLQMIINLKQECPKGTKTK